MFNVYFILVFILTFVCYAGVELRKTAYGVTKKKYLTIISLSFLNVAIAILGYVLQHYSIQPATLMIAFLNLGVSTILIYEQISLALLV